MNFLPKTNNISEDQLNRNRKRKSNEPGVCNYEFFNKIRKKLNIHFDNNYNEFCSFCNEHSIHHNSKYSEKLCDCLCNLCQKFEVHIKNANESRNLMRKDSKTTENRNDSEVILSADMQKSLLFPIIRVKDNYFTEKLTSFNQTFAELGENNDAFCLLSFDAKISKGANEFVNFYLQVLKSPKYSDKKSITFYVDNCYYQNKNYILFTNLLLIINDPTIAFDEILFIYLEKGHIFMSADGIHGDITRQMRKNKNIYTFDQFVKVIENSRKKISIKTLIHKDILIFQRMEKQNLSKNFKLNDIKQCLFKKNCFEMKVKFSHSFDQPFISKDILKPKYKRMISDSFQKNNSFISKINVQKKPKGLSSDMLNAIKNNYSVIPMNYMSFFDSLYVNDI
jgi:hypothetical protein